MFHVFPGEHTWPKKIASGATLDVPETKPTNRRLFCGTSNVRRHVAGRTFEVPQNVP